MRILQYGLTNHVGGIETYLRKITTTLHNNNDLEFSFLIIGNEQPCFYEEFLKLGCKFYFITPRKQSYFKNYSELVSLLETEKFDVCHFHFNSLSYILPAKIASKYCDKIIIHSRNADVKLGIISNVLHKINYFLIPKNAYLVAVSDLAGKWMYGKKQFKVINNGIKLQSYKYNPISRKELREKYGMNDNIVVTNVGAFRYQKNHKFLLEIFRALMEINDHYKLVLVGDGSLLNVMKDYARKLNIEKNILFLGNMDNIADILSASDAFIFPSFYEGFPNALLEAHASNLNSFYSDTITKDIDFPKLGIRISLEKTAENWAIIIDEKMRNKNNRDNYNDHDELRKFSVENEIHILQKLYRGI
ncbi:glycosyltransferase [Trichococcus flocculiformis]|uniref:glycosyltransferase n=1 Tax=Trichococcus flocculiformis TaxID=82803 RepID=UPI002AAC217C|nr:glycosyltransferase [Trichococcus flocculiformis]